ncbi:MAG: SPOR domain-containing protein [Acinetobacter sp.]
MSMNSKQRWMGGVVLLGGGVLLAALLMKGTQELQQKQSTKPDKTQVATNTVEKPGEMQALQPLTVDVETEKRLLEEQRHARERAVAEQEARTQQYLAQQQQAEAEAARKAAEEYNEINKRRLSEQASSDNIPPDMGGEKSKLNTDASIAGQTAQKSALTPDEAARKKSLQETAQKKQAEADAARKSAAEAERQANISAQKKADEAARNKAELAAKKRIEEKKQADLAAKKQAEIDAQKQAQVKKQAEADAQRKLDEKRKADAKKKADAENARKLLEGGDAKTTSKDTKETDVKDSKKWMVQVALAGNQANADSIVSRLRAKGYKVVTSPTSKGVRIMVGPSKDRDTADAARKKIQADSSLGMKSAWVIDWVPLDQR